MKNRHRWEPVAIDRLRVAKVKFRAENFRKRKNFPFRSQFLLGDEKLFFIFSGAWPIYSMNLDFLRNRRGKQRAMKSRQGKKLGSREIARELGTSSCFISSEWWTISKLLSLSNSRENSPRSNHENVIHHFYQDTWWERTHTSSARMEIETHSSLARITLIVLYYYACVRVLTMAPKWAWFEVEGRSPERSKTRWRLCRNENDPAGRWWKTPELKIEWNKVWWHRKWNALRGK